MTMALRPAQGLMVKGVLVLVASSAGLVAAQCSREQL